MNGRWATGTVVALRDVWFERVWRAVPGVVVEDAGEDTLLWVPRGVESVFPVDTTGKEIRMPTRDFRRGLRVTARETLVLVRAGEPWTLWHFFREDGAFDHWYLNLEEILGRSACTIDGRDHKLDVLVDPDGTHRLKDEDELEEAARLGLLDATAVREAAQRTLASAPWPTGWESWRPDPGWRLPSLPEGWDSYAER